MRTTLLMTRATKLLVACMAVLLALTGSAWAAPIGPTFDTFGSLPAATFGGSGIPNDAVAITKITNGGDTITLGLTVTERFSEPPVGNDGAGTFSALAGGFPGSPDLARWNFNWFVEIVGGGTFGDYVIDLLFDFDPGAGTDDSAHGVIHFSTFAPTATLSQDSQNLGFGFLGTAVPTVLTPPTFPSFDPNAIGEYTFALRASAIGGGLLGQSAIQVNRVPEPASMALFGLTALGLAGVHWRRRRPVLQTV